MEKYEKSLSPFISLLYFAATSPHGFLPLHLSLPLFICLFFSSPNHFLPFLCSHSFSLSFFYKLKNITLHSEKAYNGVGSFPADSPRQTHTHSLSRCYLKSHCAHKDKPQQPEHHTASDKVHSSKFATVEI